jgi:hypothetical protein
MVMRFKVLVLFCISFAFCEWAFVELGFYWVGGMLHDISWVVLLRMGVQTDISHQSLSESN